MAKVKRTRKRVYGFAHIGNPIEFNCLLPFKLSSDLTVCRPTPTQLKRIRKHLHDLNRFDDFRTPYESIWKRKPGSLEQIRLASGKVEEIQWMYAEEKPLPKSKWKYAIVKYRSNGLILPYYKPLELLDLELASLVGPRHLHLFSSYGSWSMRSSPDTELFDFLQHGVHEDHTEKWSLEDLQILKQTYDGIVKTRIAFPSLYHTLKLYWSLPKLRGFNELLCLGLFSVIESIVTHNPKGESDSISHQIAAKVKLLTNRFDTAVEHKFGPVDEQKLWRKLYEFRSKLAHGGAIEFRGNFQILKNAYEVQCFLEAFLKTLLQFALREPQLCIDLKEC